MDESAFKEVSKEKFKEIYFRLGGGDYSGWTTDYWRKFFEDEVKPGWRFMVEEPKSPKHDSMRYKALARFSVTRSCSIRNTVVTF